MTEPVFLDTAGWFAALSPRDQDHHPAARAYRALIDEAQRPCITTNLVVAEMHALLARRLGAATAVRFLDQLHADATHEVVWATRDVERHAVDRWLRPFADHAFSLTDAVSFEVMRQRGIREALTFDNHFTVAGFTFVHA